MFNPDFYPTPDDVINLMLNGEDINGKVILEPSAGKGNIVDYLLQAGAAQVIAAEQNPDLKKILQTKCKVIADDFLTLTSEQISHIDFIVMNPPFSADEKHINHAFNIAPAGCRIIALCNYSTIKNQYSAARQELGRIVENYGQAKDLGQCFTQAERTTAVNVGLIKLTKPGENKKSEFEGFFLDEEPEEQGENGLMPYNVVRDLVNRYVAACKLYDEQLNTGAKMHSLLNSFYGEGLTFTCTENGAPKLKNEFRKDLQRAGWGFIFNKMDLNKHSTKGLKEEINKFVEQQTNIPFTMKNIYHMLDMVIQTTGQRMDKAILEAFDTITAHHHENRQYIKGWKTNSHFLVGKKFILPSCVNPSKEYGYTSTTYRYLSSNKTEIIEDLEKALCFANGINYDEICPVDYYNRINTDTPRNKKTLKNSIDNNIYGDYYESYFFRYKAFKNGNMHFEFINEDIRGKFNQKVSKLKGYPLFEAKEQTAYQNRQTGRGTQAKANPAHAYKPTILTTIKLKTA